jgi:flagellar basal body rod protein FlgG
MGRMTIAPVGGLGAAIHHAQRGMQDAAQRFAQAAEAIAAPAAPVRETPPAVTPPLAMDMPAMDMPGAMISAMQAQRAYEANIATIRTADAMQRELLRSM